MYSSSSRTCPRARARSRGAWSTHRTGGRSKGADRHRRAVRRRAQRMQPPGAWDTHLQLQVVHSAAVQLATCPAPQKNHCPMVSYGRISTDARDPCICASKRDLNHPCCNNVKHVDGDANKEQVTNWSSDQIQLTKLRNVPLKLLFIVLCVFGFHFNRIRRNP